MAKRNQISLILHSAAENGGYLDLDVLGKSNALSKFLKIREKECAKRQGVPKGQVIFRLVQLSHSSPITIVFEAHPKSEKLSPVLVCEDIEATLNDIKQGKMKNLSNDTLSAANKFAKYESNKIRHAEFNIKIESRKTISKFALDQKFIGNLKNSKQHLKPRKPGALAGKLWISPDFDKPISLDEIFGSSTKN
ncbi:MAG: hypothetical protein OXU53_03925 [Deltaproteobacteria bacterium]|nr:hypothetical protein [Deltaproteobacteria bacterium]